MLLKNYLKEAYLEASLNSNDVVMENIIFVWAHRFGVSSLSQLTLDNKPSKSRQEENQIKLKNEEQICQLKEDLSHKDHHAELAKLPLPAINNLRKWININNKAS